MTAPQGVVLQADVVLQKTGCSSLDQVKSLNLSCFQIKDVSVLVQCTNMEVSRVWVSFLGRRLFPRGLIMC